jgi:hypothetical protein
VLGYLGAWLLGYLGAWLLGYLGAWGNSAATNSPTTRKKQPCTAGEIWRVGILFALDHFSKNRLASQT